jgi:xylulokinase
MARSLQQSKRYVLSIDLGSGGYKAAIVADSGEMIASAGGAITTHILPYGGVEQDPVEWWEGVKQAAKKVIRESNVAPEDIVAIGCDSQWSVVVPVDEHAEPLMQAVHWMDTRGGRHNCHITAGFPSIQGSGFKVPFFALRATQGRQDSEVRVQPRYWSRNSIDFL